MALGVVCQARLTVSTLYLESLLCHLLPMLLLLYVEFLPVATFAVLLRWAGALL